MKRIARVQRRDELPALNNKNKFLSVSTREAQRKLYTDRGILVRARRR